MENWKDIKGYEGFYQISDLGRIKSLERDVFNSRGIVIRHIKEKILVQSLDRNGYPGVHLFKNGKSKTTLVHRLVAIAFLPNPENKPQVNHIDEVKTNNAVDNLEWCDSQYNINYGTRTERMVQNRRYSKLGDNPNAKPVFCEELNKKFDSIRSAEEELGILRTSIGKACRGEIKRAGGFHWRYANEYD